ncbi:MAG TPA: MaoC/PaaZ C-terminal domain-containing protein [Anaeromyxobacteraceae bacterium]|nr:MaoC/PaaZ C-terminal domain-containing protein [Anaeromyxobacteraceae bacterium]
MSLLARQLYFEAVKVGDELPPLVKPPIDRVLIARYSGATGEFNPLSLDEIHARNAGFPSVIAPGLLAMGFAGELVVDWLRGARLRRFSSRFVKIIWPGDVLTCRAKVVERRFGEPGSYFVDIDVSAENQRGELVLRGQVTAQLYYNADDDARQRGGQPALVIGEAEEAARFAKLHPPPRRPAPKPQPAPPAAARATAPVTATAMAKPAAPAAKPLAPRTAPAVKVAAAPRAGAAATAAAKPASPAAKPAPAKAPARPAAKATRPASRPAAKPGQQKKMVAKASGQRARPASRPAAKGKAAKGKAHAAARKPARSLPPSKPAARAGRSAPGKKPSARKRR